MLVVIEMTALAALARAYYRIYPEDSTTAQEINPYVNEKFRPRSVSYLQTYFEIVSNISEPLD